MAADERDPQFERALAQHLKRAAAQPDCPDAEILAAYHERTLASEEMAHWKLHIAGCSLCQESLALVEATESLATEEREESNIYAAGYRTAPAATAAYDSALRGEETPTARANAAAQTAKVTVMKRRSPLRWAIAAGSLAAGAILWVAFQPKRPASQHTSPGVEVAQKAASPEDSAPPAFRREENQLAHRASREDLAPLSKAVPSVSTDLKSAAPRLPQAGPRSTEAYTYGSGNGVAPIPKVSPHEKKADEPPLFTDSLTTLPRAPATEGDSTKAARTEQMRSIPPGGAPAPKPPAPNRAVNQTVVVAAANERAKEEAEAKAKDSVAVEASSAAQEVVVESRPDNGIANYAVVGGLLEQGRRRVISASGSNHAWRVGERGKIEFTSNGGKQWKEQVSGVTASLTSGSAPSKKICWIAGKGGVLLLTTDAGKHWKQVATPTAADLGGVTAVDGRRARIRDAADTTAYETSDGGKTWSAIPIE